MKNIPHKAYPHTIPTKNLQYMYIFKPLTLSMIQGFKDMYKMLWKSHVQMRLPVNTNAVNYDAINLQIVIHLNDLEQ